METSAAELNQIVSGLLQWGPSVSFRPLMGLKFVGFSVEFVCMSTRGCGTVRDRHSSYGVRISRSTPLWGDDGRIFLVLDATWNS